MQTFNIQVEDGFMQEFLNFVQSRPKEIHMEDPNLAHDPYFYKRQKELKQLRADIKSGKVEMIDNDTAEAEIEVFLKTL